MSERPTIRQIRLAFDHGDHGPLNALLRDAFDRALRPAALPASEFSLLRTDRDTWPREHRDEAFQAWCLDLWKGGASGRKVDVALRRSDPLSYLVAMAQNFLRYQRRVRLRSDPDTAAAINQAARIRAILRDPARPFSSDSAASDNPLWSLRSHRAGVSSPVSPNNLEAFARTLMDDELGLRNVSRTGPRADPALYDSGLAFLLERVLERAGGAVAERDLIRVAAGRTGNTRTVESLDDVADLAGLAEDPGQVVADAEQVELLVSRARAAADSLSREDQRRLTVLAQTVTSADQRSSRAGSISRAANAAGVAVNTMRATLARALAALDDLEPLEDAQKRTAFQLLLDRLIGVTDIEATR